MSIYEKESTERTDFTSKKQAALYYANQGWAVFPLKPNGKTPITEHGFKDATRDVDQITKWWTDTPDANIGVPTGSVSGFWVIDVDRKNDKDGLTLLLNTLQGEDKVAFKTALSSNLVQTTTSDGLHVLVQWSPESPVRNGTDVMEGIDLRGEGGYIVVDPSSVDKGMYQWSDLSLPIAPYQTWMDILFAKKSKAKNGNTRKSKRGTPKQSTAALITELFLNPPSQGCRDKLLFKAATKLVSARI